MNELHVHGVEGVRVIVYGTTLDSPGRREILAMQTVTAFYPCPHCLHTAQPGVRGQVYGGFRRFLNMRSRFRNHVFRFHGHTYMFRDAERRPPPRPRTDHSVAAMVARARRNRPFCGHKAAPFFDNWVGVDWKGSTCDAMHDKKCFCVRFLETLVGSNASDGIYLKWRQKKRDIQHREDCEVYDIFEEVHDGTTSFPWRLSKDDVNMLDQIVRSMWWPHYVDILHWEGHSFWTHSDRMWKSVHKYFILMVILPTCLLGFVPAVHTAILMIVYALRRLEGQVLSESEAVDLGVEPGSRVIDKALIPHFREALILGFVLLEGSFPVATLNPASHHFVHYGEQTGFLGILRWFAMWSFERNNKKIKGLVRNARFSMTSLANNVQMDIAARFRTNFVNQSESARKRACTCYLIRKSKPNGFYALSRREKFDLEMLGLPAAATAFDIAHVLGVHFRAGEWGRRRCGSVITTMLAGRSRYCYVKKFLRVQGEYFARVVWLSVPEYPCAPNRLVVTVRMLPREQQIRYNCMLSLKKIDPCGVTVRPHPGGVRFSVMRDRGYDRVLR